MIVLITICTILVLGVATVVSILWTNRNIRKELEDEGFFD